MDDNPYRMRISLNVLNHLGLNLYSNRPAVLAEVIANAWDADATEVRIDFDFDNPKITISDNGHGMDLADVNTKYLFVGYQKRLECLTTPNGRKPMGRKGIGKLSLFSIANRISVHSYKEGMEPVSFAMDAEEIHKVIGGEDPSSVQSYRPEVLEQSHQFKHRGTVIEITDLKKMRLNKATVNNLRKRVARRFWVENPDDFRIFVDNQEVTTLDRDYFSKARFLFQYGEHDYSQYCKNLETVSDTGKKLCFLRHNTVENIDGDSSKAWNIKGWIGVARHSNYLDSSGGDDNLNRIAILVRGKVAQEDILQEFRLGGLITKYLYGEVHADFLDDDDKEDIATSGRQKIAEDDQRYVALKAFIQNELKDIWQKTNKLKERVGLEVASKSNPFVKNWYDNLKPKNVQDAARKMFGIIERAGIEEAHLGNFYANSILAIENLKIGYALQSLDLIDESNLEMFLEQLSDIDAIEAARYHEIVKERLGIIDKLQNDVEAEVLEKILQQYIFDHLWLLDPAWERATQFAEMEQTIQQVINDKVEISRLDIRYKRVMAGHVVVELKRGGVRVSASKLEEQARRYYRAVRAELRRMKVSSESLEVICIVDQLPREWDDFEERKIDERALELKSIRVVSYKELIQNARSAYSKFIEQSKNLEDIRTLVENVRSYSKDDRRSEASDT